DATALALELADIELCLRVASLNWSEVDPTIFGTLFVRGLDPDKRSEMRADKGALAALSQHFNHLSRAMTDSSYVGKNWRLKELLSEEGEEQVATNLMS